MARETLGLRNGTYLEIVFKNSSDEDIIFLFYPSKQEIGTTRVKNLASAILSSGDIFMDVPVSFVSAREITIDDNSYDFSL